MKKGVLSDLSPLTQLLTLVLLILFCFICSSFLLLLCFSFLGKQSSDQISQSVLFIQLSQLFTVLTTFLLPSLIMAWLCSKNPVRFLHLGRFPSAKIILLMVAAGLLILPFISLLVYYNGRMQLPSFMAPIEEWMRLQESLSAQLVERLVAERGLSSFLMNVLVIALAAGFIEELLFRGVLFSILQRSISNHHLLIWLVATLFSAIHLQFFGFFPRLILGAYLGYLLYWSKNCWLPIIAHSFNNLFVLVCMSHHSLKDHSFLQLKSLTSQNLTTLLLFAAGGLPLFFLCLRWIKREYTAREGGEGAS